ncbi:hypothetical protein P7K49_026454 [Saguinus oedipus]|uniref:C2H2-type domain-containing protein n=1 Tax=Saguinus oedipus TaxID=9490 RepID=A0ABQ9UD65_SAGOE|nr:hypothetical protein P7K49_026454 [Saguinus oedipus]
MGGQSLQLERGLKCPVCSFVYGTKWEFNRHLKNKHGLKVVEIDGDPKWEPGKPKYWVQTVIPQNIGFSGWETSEKFSHYVSCLRGITGINLKLERRHLTQSCNSTEIVEKGQVVDSIHETVSSPEAVCATWLPGMPCKERHPSWQQLLRVSPNEETAQAASCPFTS